MQLACVCAASTPLRQPLGSVRAHTQKPHQQYRNIAHLKVCSRAVSHASTSPQPSPDTASATSSSRPITQLMPL